MSPARTAKPPGPKRPVQAAYLRGHVEANEVPAEAAVREVREETGIKAAIIGRVNFAHQTSRSMPLPFAILDRTSRDRKIGPHRCVSFVSVCRPIGGDLSPQLD